MSERKCLVCHKNPAALLCSGSVDWRICKDPECLKNLGPWLMDDGEHGHFHYISLDNINPLPAFSVQIHNKTHQFQCDDRRVLRGVGNRIIEILKEHEAREAAKASP